MNKYLFLFIAAVLFVLASCEYKVIEKPTVEITQEDPVSFADQIQPILTAKCITCHASTNPVMTEGVSYGNLTSGSYVNTDAPAESVIYQRVLSGHPGGANSLSDGELALLLMWIEEGAQDN